MIAYISLSFNKRESLKKELAVISETLNKLNITPLIFVNQFNFNTSQEHEMMQQAMIHIDRCDFLIAETSEKGIGIGVEVGYAKGKGKSVIYLRNKGAEHSTTVSGISDFQVVYSDSKDLRQQLESIITEFNKK